MSALPDDRREFVRALFVLATEALEDAHIAASDGQADRADARRYVRLAASLKVTADHLRAVAAVIALAAKSS